jgi:aryl-alcohol dehydrogenase-like predicted oxidoreductase
MNAVTLGRSDLQVSPVAFGTWQLGGDWGKVDVDSAVAAIRHAREIGINFFDTAQAYGFGASEKLLGDALREDLDHNRDEVVLATKGGVRLTAQGDLERDSSPSWIQEGVEQSLKAMGVDHIDLYQVHWPDPNVPFEETAGALNDLVEAGKIRHVGVSNFGVEEMRAFSRGAAIETLQPPYHLFRRDIENEVLPFCVNENIGVLVYSPLGSGLLSGQLREGSTFPEGDWRGRSPVFQGDLLRRNLAVTEELGQLAREGFGCSVSQLSIAWVLARPGVHVAIVGSQSPSHLEAAVAASSISLNDEDLHRIDAVMSRATPVGGPTPEGF